MITTEYSVKSNFDSDLLSLFIKTGAKSWQPHAEGGERIKQDETCGSGCMSEVWELHESTTYPYKIKKTKNKNTKYIS